MSRATNAEPKQDIRSEERLLGKINGVEYIKLIRRKKGFCIAQSRFEDGVLIMEMRRIEILQSSNCYNIEIGNVLMGKGGEEVVPQPIIGI